MKSFENSNHLGNVLIAFSGVPKPVASISNITQIDHYSVDVISFTDYYAFGALMPARQFHSPDYKYGFNGKEKMMKIM